MTLEDDVRHCCDDIEGVHDNAQRVRKTGAEEAKSHLAKFGCGCESGRGTKRAPTTKPKVHNEVMSMQPKRNSNVSKPGKSKAGTPLPPSGRARSIDQQPDQAHGARMGSPPTPDEIRQLAYEKWEAAGKPPGDGTHFWLQAEKELLDRN